MVRVSPDSAIRHQVVHAGITPKRVDLGHGVVAHAQHFFKRKTGITRRIGDRVGRREVVGVVADPLGTTSVPLVSEEDGIIVGRTNLPIVNRGDAVFHIAKAKPLSKIRERADMAVALADEDEII